MEEVLYVYLETSPVSQGKYDTNQHCLACKPSRLSLKFSTGPLCRDSQPSVCPYNLKPILLIYLDMISVALKVLTMSSSPRALFIASLCHVPIQGDPSPLYKDQLVVAVRSHHVSHTARSKWITQPMRVHSQGLHIEANHHIVRKHSRD